MGSTDLKKSSWAFREAPIRVPETLRVRQRFSKSSGDFKKSSGDFLRNQIQPAESLLIICTAGSKVPRTNQQTVNVTILSLFKIVMPWQFFFLAMFKFAFKTILKVLMLIPRNESQLHSADLVEHVAFELEAVARPHVLQQVDYLLPTTVLLAKIYFVLILGNSSSHQRQRINGL